MAEFWESSFKDKETMWGFEPADCVCEIVELFGKHGINNVLIPGFGYGRNARLFCDNGIAVTGIEISKTAIELARQHYGEEIPVHHGSVTDMPFDDVMYDGIFCYALIHLLSASERASLIRNCYNQLRPGGYMVFVAISKNTPVYGEGKETAKDTFLTPHGVEIFYYDADSVSREFDQYGLIEAKEITEPAEEIPGRSSQRFWQIVCRK